MLMVSRFGPGSFRSQFLNASDRLRIEINTLRSLAEGNKKRQPKTGTAKPSVEVFLQ